MFDHSGRVSMRQFGRKFGCTHPHIIKTLAKYTDVKTYSKYSIPDRQESQKERIKINIDRFYRNFLGNSVIFDEESFFTRRSKEKAPTTPVAQTRFRRNIK